MPSRSLDFGKSLTYMFEEPDWIKKFAIGVLIMVITFPLMFLLFVPALIPAMITLGYSIEISRRVAYDQTPVMPEWNEWGKYFKDGAYFSLAALVYSLPIALPVIGLACVSIATADSASGEVSGLMVLMIMAFSCVTMLYIIPLYIFLYGGLVEYLRTNEFSAYFKFRRLSVLKSDQDGNPRKNFAIALLLIAIPLAAAGSVIPLLGTFWAYLAQGHLIGQLVKQSSPELPAEPAHGMVSTL